MTLPAGTTLPAPGDARELRRALAAEGRPGQIGRQIEDRRDWDEQPTDLLHHSRVDQPPPDGAPHLARFERIVDQDRAGLRDRLPERHVGHGPSGLVRPRHRCGHPNPPTASCSNALARFVRTTLATRIGGSGGPAATSPASPPLRVRGAQALIRFFWAKTLQGFPRGVGVLRRGRVSKGNALYRPLCLNRADFARVARASKGNASFAAGR